MQKSVYVRMAFQLATLVLPFPYYLALSSLKMAERTRLELATPGVTGRYSNQLNYRSTVWWV